MPVYRQPKSKALFKNALSAVKFTAKQTHTGSKQLAVAAIQGRTWSPLFVFQLGADLQRMQVGAAIKGLKYTIPATATAVVTPVVGPVTKVTVGREPSQAEQVRPVTPLPPQPIAVPASPRRRAELFGINLRMVAPRAAIKMERGRLENHTPAKNFSRRALTSARGTKSAFTATATVAVGKAVTLELQGGRLRRTQLTLAGSQSVRVIFQGAAEDLISDQYVTGQIVLTVPPRARRVTLIGEGMHPPIAGSPLAGAAAPVIREALGVEHDSTCWRSAGASSPVTAACWWRNTALPFAVEADGQRSRLQGAARRHQGDAALAGGRQRMRRADRWSRSAAAIRPRRSTRSAGTAWADSSVVSRRFRVLRARRC